jgi:hypothetical protein
VESALDLVGGGSHKVSATRFRGHSFVGSRAVGSQCWAVGTVGCGVVALGSTAR